MPSLGNKLRAFRQERHLTLQQIADGASCSAAYLSQIEHDKTSPSIATLKRIAQALDLRIVDFFMDQEEEAEVVLRPEQWVEVSLPRWKADIRQMIRHVKHRQMQPFYTVIQPGGGTKEDYNHQGEEFGLVLEGVLTLTVGSETYQVEAGSSFYYSSTLPHAWSNQIERPCRVVWVVTPPSW